MPSGRTTSASAARALVDQLVPERGGAEPPRPGRAGQRPQPGRIERVGDGVRHALDPVQVVGGQARVEVPHPGRGLVTVGLDEQDGQAGGRGGPGELADLRIGRGPGAQQQGGQVGSAQLGQVGGHDDLVPVAGDRRQAARCPGRGCRPGCPAPSLPRP
ncbi:MAG TPA: hypothetical protein VJ418_14345 [Streptosporangiaceae bacterium]|nr:hypothetical protein [Streptosporangiaceae bacterium]